MPLPWLLEARHVGRRKPHRDQWLLREVDFGVAAGERIALVGPSGSGKTLLLRALARLDPMDEGDVLWQGESIRGGRIPDYRRRAIYLHQRPALLEGSVVDNLRAPFRLRVNRDRQFSQTSIVHWLEQLGRGPDFLDKNVRELSGGEAQLVALLRAVQLEPQVLLLDEPTAALDQPTTRAVEQLVRIWHEQLPDQRALIWVSHNPEQTDRVACRHVTIQAGRLVKD